MSKILVAEDERGTRLIVKQFLNPNPPNEGMWEAF